MATPSEWTYRGYSHLSKDLIRIKFIPFIRIRQKKKKALDWGHIESNRII